MTTDELMPSPTKRGCVWESRLVYSPLRMGAMRRPYAITCQGRSETVAVNAKAKRTVAPAAANVAPERATDKNASTAAAAASQISNVSELRVPMEGIRARLNASAPRIEPRVLTA